MPAVPYPSLFPWSWHPSVRQVEKLTVCGWVYVPVFVLAMRQSCSLTGAMPRVQDMCLHACMCACMHVHACACMLYGAGGSSPDSVCLWRCFGVCRAGFSRSSVALSTSREPEVPEVLWSPLLGCSSGLWGETRGSAGTVISLWDFVRVSGMFAGAPGAFTHL